MAASPKREIAPTINHMQDFQYNEPRLWQSVWPTLNAQSHKYNRGYVWIQGGYPITGASKLAALAAARLGAGMTVIAVPAAAWPAYASSLLSVMVKPYANPSELAATYTDKRIHAYLIGPGAGLGADTLSTTRALLATKKPLVLDADACTSLTADTTVLTQAGHSKVVLTPHAGEFAQLFGMQPANDLHTRLAQVCAVAKDSQCHVLLKGAQTIIASPDHQVIVHTHSPPTLATAGAGDVLAGMISSLMAQGMPPLAASAAACWVHGEAAYQFGQGLIAEDLVATLPQVLARLHSQ